MKNHRNSDALREKDWGLDYKSKSIHTSHENHHWKNKNYKFNLENLFILV